MNNRISHTTQTPVAEIPSSIEELIDFSVSCPCGKEHRVDLQAVSIRSGAVDDLPDMVRRFGTRLRIAVTADRITREITGEKVRRLLERDAHTVSLLTVPDGPGGRPHAEEGALALTETALENADLAVAVGSGTINDLTKLAAFNTKIPYIVAATAPSMNGYTSAIAAMMIKGVKRTVPCAQPVAVVADLDILQNAPLELIAAGLGDLESKPTAAADYRLGALIRGDDYCRAPESVVKVAERRAAETAARLKRRDPEAIAILTEALILSGLSMKLAGSSSPASGGEHLISHFWDMTAADQGRIEGFHGAQVGVATIVTAALYEHLAALSSDAIKPDAIIAARPSIEAEAATVRALHGNFAVEIDAGYRLKRPDEAALRARLEFLKENWGEIWDAQRDLLRPAAQIRKTLRAAGAPTTVGELGLSPEHLRNAFHAARRIRNRYTVLDLAFDIGVLETHAAQVLTHSGCLGS